MNNIEFNIDYMDLATLTRLRKVLNKAIKSNDKEYKTIKAPVGEMSYVQADDRMNRRITDGQLVSAVSRLNVAINKHL